MAKVKLKPLLIEKGERIGLYVAAGLSLLIVGMGIMKGLSAGSASANAKQLNDKLSALESKQNSAQPGPNDKPSGEAFSLKGLAFAEVRPDQYPNQEVFATIKVKDDKRQLPVVLKPDEYAVELLRMQLPGLAFTLDARADGRKVPKLVTMTEPAGMGGAMGAAGVAGAAGAPPGGMGGSGSGFGGLLGSNRGGAGAIGGAGASGAAGGVRGGQPGRRFNPRPSPSGIRGEGGVKTEEIEVEKAEELFKQGKKAFAVRALPMRVGVIAASFPYKQQVEEFKQKLRLKTHGEVVTERVRGAKDASWNSFQFRGLEVERAMFDPELAANRNVRVEDWKPKEEDWVPLPIADSYKWILINILSKVEEEPKDLEPVTKTGLVMAMPKSLDDSTKAPDISKKLKNVQATLEKLGRLSDSEKKKSLPPSKLIDTDFDAFRTGGTPTTGGGGSGTPAPPPGGGMGQFNIPGSGPEKDVKETPIDHCLIRFLDVSDDAETSLKPGKIYRYRFKIRMANPNYAPVPLERKDTYPDLAKDMEIVSDWNYVDKDLVVPPDTFVYATDVTSRPVTPADRETVFSFHRWVESFKPNSSAEWPIGEWVIAPRVPIRRGEYVKTTLPCPVPVKVLSSHNFAVKPDAKISFGDESRWVDGVTVYPVLVDFEGGKISVQRQVPGPKEGDPMRTATIQDEVKPEVLIFNPDGRVEARHNATDTPDPERVNRHKDYQLRLDKIKNKPGGNVLGN